MNKFRLWLDYRKLRRLYMTNGMKSSEFWMSLAAVLLKWLGPIFGAEFPNEAFMAVIGYVVSRGIAKHGQTT